MGGRGGGEGDFIAGGGGGGGGGLSPRLRRLELRVNTCACAQQSLLELLELLTEQSGANSKKKDKKL